MTALQPKALILLLGLKKITLNVVINVLEETWKVPSPGTVPYGYGAHPPNIFSPDGAPNTPLMRHLLDVFIQHFGCQFPFIEFSPLAAKIETGTASMCCRNCSKVSAVCPRQGCLIRLTVCCRFSTHTSIALPHLKPCQFGNVFYHRSKQLLGSMLAVPCRETVVACVLLAHLGFANGEGCVNCPPPPRGL